MYSIKYLLLLARTVGKTAKPRIVQLQNYPASPSSIPVLFTILPRFLFVSPSHPILYRRFEFGHRIFCCIIEWRPRWLTTLTAPINTRTEKNKLYRDLHSFLQTRVSRKFPLKTGPPVEVVPDLPCILTHKTFNLPKSQKLQLVQSVSSYTSLLYLFFFSSYHYPHFLLIEDSLLDWCSIASLLFVFTVESVSVLVSGE